MRSKGFTLIELLVVISLISFLSSVTVSTTQAVRKKAEASRSTQIVSQYQRAFTAYYSDNGSYPTPSDNVPANKCLGNHGGLCGTQSSPGVYTIPGEQNAQLDAEVSSVYPAMPTFKIVEVSNTWWAPIYHTGPEYECLQYVGGRCMSVILTWYEPGETGCGTGEVADFSGLATSCFLELK